MLAALLSNVAYLLWPQAPDSLVIRPHPAMLRTYPEDPPVLVATSAAGTENYMLLETQTDATGKTLHHTEKIKHPPSPAEIKKNFTGTININTAPLSQLQLLPGIGPKMAERILAYRKSNGPFQTITQLQNIPGIGPKKLAALTQRCTL